MCIACLLPLDVAIRRVQLDLSWLRRLFRRNQRESTATMGALLQRAGALRESMNKDREQKSAGQRSEPVTGRPMLPRQQPPRAPSTKDSNTESKSSAPSAPPPPADGGTTSRLLEIKRRREQDGEGKK